MGPIINIILGVIMIVGGLTGKLALIGTNSPQLLVAVGVVILGLGVYRVIQRRRPPPGSSS